MSDQQRVAAERAFAALCAFDGHLVERRELLANGVSERQVNALYGRPYPALVPNLMLHIEYTADEALLAPGSLQFRQAYNALESVSDAVFTRLEEAWEADSAELRALELVEELSNCIAERFAEAARHTLNAAESTLTGADVAGATEVAYRLQANRTLLASAQQVLADELMVAVARTIGL